MPGLDERGRGRQAVGEPGARGVHVERRARRRRASAGPRRRSRGTGCRRSRSRTTIMSSCAAEMPAVSSAIRAASTARSEVTTPSSAKWRASMPVRSRIHSSVVSTLRLEPRVRDEAGRKRRADAGDGGVSGHGPEDIGVPRAQPPVSGRRRPRGSPRRPRSRRGVDALHQLREHVAGPGLEEPVVAPAAGERADARLPPHGRDHLAPEQLAELAASVDELAGDVLGDRERGVADLDPPEHLEDAARPPAASARSGTRPATGSRTARVFRSFASASSRSIAGDDAARHDLRGGVLVRDDQDVVAARPRRTAPARRRRRRRAAPSSRPDVPRPPRCIASPRIDDELERVAAGATASAATSAANSPSECPATPTGSVEPSGRSTRNAATSHASSAGCTNAVVARRRVVVAAGDDVAAHRLGCLLEHRRARPDAPSTGRPSRRTATPAPGTAPRSRTYGASDRAVGRATTCHGPVRLPARRRPPGCQPHARPVE